MLGKIKKYLYSVLEQPVFSWLLLRDDKKAPEVSKKVRVRRVHLPLTLSSELVISLRKFRTSKVRRSRNKKQLVFGLRGLLVKEVAIAKARRSRRLKKSPKSYDYRLLWRPVRLVPLALIIFGLGGILYFGLNLSRHVRLEPIVSAQALVQTAEKPAAPKTLPRSNPTTLKVDRLGLNASLAPVGLNADGSIQIPAPYDKAGWYKLGPTPGELGPAIIVGHVDSWQGTAVFWRLRELRPGDIVKIKRADSKTIKFRVDKITQFPRNKLPTRKIFGNIDYAGIRIMTCGGDFDLRTHQYNENTVIFGSLVI